MARYIATAVGFDGVTIRNPGDVFEAAADFPKGEWFEAVKEPPKGKAKAESKGDDSGGDAAA